MKLDKDVLMDAFRSKKLNKVAPEGIPSSSRTTQKRASLQEHPTVAENGESILPPRSFFAEICVPSFQQNKVSLLLCASYKTYGNIDVRLRKRAREICLINMGAGPNLVGKTLHQPIWSASIERSNSLTLPTVNKHLDRSIKVVQLL